jgi:hypothetical protein
MKPRYTFDLLISITRLAMRPVAYLGLGLEPQ